MAALQGRTVLFITHRLSSITAADLIVCMGEGSVLEMGTHDELMANKGPYYVLFRQQGRSSSSSSTPFKPRGAAVLGYSKRPSQSNNINPSTTGDNSSTGPAIDSDPR
jgi:ATP-binding cassette subfamily B protein